MRRLTTFAWATLAFNVVVIVLGALVRATGSGAGCGRSWPACQGVLVPELQGSTAIEFTHRSVSGIALVLVAILVVRVFRTYEPGHPARIGAVISGVAIVGEALIGALIVLAEWVAEDTSVARAVSVPIHLVSTFVLLAGLTLSVFWMSGGRRLRPSVHPRFRRAIYLVGIGMLLIGATGAVTALADTLFPKDAFSLSGAIDLSAEEHFLTDLRVIHPLVSIVVGVIAALWARWNGLPAGGRAATAARIVIGIVVLQFVGGVLNVLLLTPVWLSLVHLALADVLWIAWVWMSAELLQEAPVDELVPAE